MKLEKDILHFFWQLISLQKPNDQDEQMQIFSRG